MQCPYIISAECDREDYKENGCLGCPRNFAGDKSSLRPEDKKYKKIPVQEGPTKRRE